MGANPRDPGQSGKKPRMTLPPIGERVVVRCADFRCLAYRDAEGKWRDARNDKELPEVLEVVMKF